jgi:hypothetical protein
MRFVVALVLVATSVIGQDAVVSLPDNYKLQFENEWVKVTRVHYGPNAKLPAHAHTSLASAYVYLNDSGPVIFKHVGGHNSVVTRAPTKSGGFRLFRAVPDEMHEVENTSPLPSDFLRIEFKTDPVEPRTLRGNYLPEPAFDEPLEKVQFENKQLRVTRMFWPPGKSIAITQTTVPGLLVLLKRGEMGVVRWLPRGHSETVTNTAPESMAALRFELVTTPAGPAAVQ